MASTLTGRKSEFIPNSFQTPNAYVDQYMSVLTSDEWKVLTYAVRRIFGFQKRQDRISISQFSTGIRSRATGEPLDFGTGLSRPTVIKCLDQLIKYRLIKRIADDNGQHEGAEYELQLDSNIVDVTGLMARQDQMSRSQKSKMQNVKGNQSSVNDIDQPDAKDRSMILTDDQSIVLTDVGQYYLPTRGDSSVNGIDTQYPVKEEIQLKNRGKGFPEIWDRILTYFEPVNNKYVSQGNFEQLKRAQLATITDINQGERARVTINCQDSDHAAFIAGIFATSIRRLLVGVLNFPEVEIELIHE